MAITCCKDCQFRYPGCHSKCKRYIKEKAEYEKKKAFIKANEPVKLYNSDFEALKCIHSARKHKR